MVGKKHYIAIQPEGKLIIRGMEGKEKVFGQLVDDYKNNKPDVDVNEIEAFKRLEAAEVDPSLLTYSIILNNDPDEYQYYMPQRKIGTSLNQVAGSLIRSL